MAGDVAAGWWLRPVMASVLTPWTVYFPSLPVFLGSWTGDWYAFPVGSGANEDVLADPQGRVSADWHSENPQWNE